MCVCAFDGFLLWFRIAYACPATTSLCNRVVDVCYKETRWLGMHRQSKTDAGNRERHTRISNASPPTQANNTVRATNSNIPTKALYMHLTWTPDTQCTAPCATEAPGTDRPHGTHHGCNRNPPSAHTTEIVVPGNPLKSYPDTTAPALGRNRQKPNRICDVGNQNANNVGQ